MKKLITDTKVTYNKCNKIIHDIKNAQFIISGYIMLGEYDKAKEKISEIYECVKIFDSLNSTGNEVLDFMIKYKKYISERSNIKFYFDNNSNINLSNLHSDLCIAIGNAIDNAIEACFELSKKNNPYVKISIYKTSNDIHFDISNPIETKKNIQLNKYKAVSSKGNPNLHGFGINTINENVKKHNKQVTINKTNDKFLLKFIL